MSHSALSRTTFPGARLAMLALAAFLLTALPVGAQQEAADPRLQGLLEQAAAALESGDGTEAEAAARAALDIDPGHPVAMSFLGNAMVLQGRVADGIAWLTTAVAIAPDLSSAWLGIARGHLERGEFGAAIEPLREVIRLDPADVAMRLQLARALRGVGRLEEAREVIRAAVGQEPGNYLARMLEGSIALELGSSEEAVGAFEAALSVRPEDPDAARGLAAALVAQERVPEALAVLSAALETHPDDRSILVGYGDILADYPQNFGALVSAAQAYRRALALQPDDLGLARRLVDLYLELNLAAEGIELIDATPGADGDPALTLSRGRLLTRLQRYADALDTYERAIDLGAGASGWYYRGIAESNLGDLDAAIAALRRTLEIDPELAAGYRELGKVLSDRSRYAEALEVLRTAVAMLPDDPTAHYLAGTAALRADMPAEALPLLDRAIALDPGDSQAVYSRAIALRQLGRTEESQAEMTRFQQLRAADPNVGAGEATRAARAQSAYQQGVARLRLVGPEAALPYLEQAIELDPDYPVAHYTLGICHGVLEDWERAAMAFERTTELDPERPDGYSALAEAYARLGRNAEAEAMRARAMELLAKIEREQR